MDTPIIESVTEERIQASLDHLAKCANDILTDPDPDTQFMPMLVIVMPDGHEHVALVEDMPASGEQRDALADAMRSLLHQVGLHQVGAAAYLFAVETWYVSLKTDGDDAPDLADIQRPSEHPDRKEGVLVTAGDVSGLRRACMFPIIRDDEGNPSLNMHAEDMATDHVEGRFANLLSRTDPIVGAANANEEIVH